MTDDTTTRPSLEVMAETYLENIGTPPSVAKWKAERAHGNYAVRVLADSLQDALDEYPYSMTRCDQDDLIVGFLRHLSSRFEHVPSGASCRTMIGLFAADLLNWADQGETAEYTGSAWGVTKYDVRVEPTNRPHDESRSDPNCHGPAQ